MRRAVGIISKIPRAGHSKTRLAAGVGAQMALALHEAFLRDEIEQLFRPDAWALYLVHDPPRSVAERRWVRRVVSRRARCLVPGRRSLCEELHESFRLLSWGASYDEVVIVAGDVPWIEAGDVEALFGLLHDADVVLGPDGDGGYYAVGMRAPHDVFTEVRMSTSSTLDATVRLACRRGLRVALGPRLGDVDEEQDLDALDAAPRRVGRHTRQAWKRYRLREGVR